MDPVLQRVIDNLESRDRANPDLRLRAAQLLTIIKNEMQPQPIRGTWRPRTPVAQAAPPRVAMRWTAWRLRDIARELVREAGPA